MLVVADSSPIIGLVKIGVVEILPRLFGTIVIPPAVAAELSSSTRPELIRQFIISNPGWLSVRTPIKVDPISDLDAGEVEAISLAAELRAVLLLIDETAGRNVAMMRKIPTIRTAALLAKAADAGLIPDLKTVFDRLRATNFRVPSAVLDELLKRHGQSGTSGSP